MPKVDRKNYLTSDLQVKTPSKNRRHPDSVPRFSIPLRKAYNGQAPHTVARQLRIFTEFPARSPIEFCSFIFDCFHFNPYYYHTVKGKIIILSIFPIYHPPFTQTKSSRETRGSYPSMFRRSFFVRFPFLPGHRMKLAPCQLVIHCRFEKPIRI